MIGYFIAWFIFLILILTILWHSCTDTLNILNKRRFEIFYLILKNLWLGLRLLLDILMRFYNPLIKLRELRVSPLEFNKIYWSLWITRVGIVGTPPLEKHVACSSWWRVAHIIIRTIIIRIPLKVCMVQLSYPDHLKESQALSKEEQTTQAERRHPDGLYNTSGWSAWAIRI